eukprot:TRINITY_DN22314_c0_g1_i1.p1 TRINITY_DN22314_c0_g1~~TRINITY_DN22314_c0_g1_i1.p1  ORF type:complete len:210 (+),score=79.78 TRINITY_DN22314_c0_g1_i1:39-668(+)
MVMTPDQIDKIQGDLQITQQNMTVFSEMLTELTPGKEHPEDKSMFDQLHATCRAMQTRLVELVDQLEDDKLIADVLEVNDNMNNLFLRYDRYEKNKSQSLGAVRRTPAGAATGGVKLEAVGGGGAAAAAGAVGGAMAAPRPLSEAPLIDFSATASEGATSSMSTLVRIKDEDADKLAEWIGDDKDQEGTTAEFDKFLEERASATDTPRK